MVVCVFYDGNSRRLNGESGFMEKPGIEPATPGLQGIGLSPTPRRTEPLIATSLENSCCSLFNKIFLGFKITTVC